MTHSNQADTQVLAANNITKLFGGVSALDCASIEFFSGEVHCLAGENGSGKSTLMKVLSGAHRPTSGTIEIDGTSYPGLNPSQAYLLGIQLIYQDFALLPNLTVAENIALPAFLAAGMKRFRPRTAAQKAVEALEKIGVELPLNSPVGELSVADRQLTAIARALTGSARLIAMDEPTTALTWREIDALFEAVTRLKDSGTSVVFISHKMQEVFSIADRVSVMRNGKVIESCLPSQLTPASLAELMTGRSIEETIQTRTQDSDAPIVLEVRSLAKKDLFEKISFSIAAGEIVGLSGLLGSGRTEIAEALAGVAPADSGSITINGELAQITDVDSAVAAGISYVPEDRLTEGLFLDQPISDNLVAAISRTETNKLGYLNWKRLHDQSDATIDSLRIKTPDSSLAVSTLSGGNAQRVLLGKWLLSKPKVLVLNGPTVGVDVGSKFDILSILRMESLKGLAVLTISDDIPELVSICHRVLIVRGGRLVDTLSGDMLNEESILEAVTA